MLPAIQISTTSVGVSLRSDETQIFIDACNKLGEHEGASVRVAGLDIEVFPRNAAMRCFGVLYLVRTLSTAGSKRGNQQMTSTGRWTSAAQQRGDARAAVWLPSMACDTQR
eukprot:9137241-Pyramimonas_sp.AAC.1